MSMSSKNSTFAPSLATSSLSSLPTSATSSSRHFTSKDALASFLSSKAFLPSTSLSTIYKAFSEIGRAGGQALEDQLYGAHVGQRLVAASTMGGSRLVANLPTILLDPPTGFARLASEWLLTGGVHLSGIFNKSQQQRAADVSHGSIDLGIVASAAVLGSRILLMPAGEAAAFAAGTFYHLADNTLENFGAAQKLSEFSKPLVQTAMGLRDKAPNLIGKGIDLAWRGARTMVSSMPLILATELPRGFANYQVSRDLRQQQVNLVTRDRQAAFALRTANSNDTCNGLEEICKKDFRNVVMLGTHNSFITSLPFNFQGIKSILNPLGRLAENQATSVEQQFADGIRLFFLEYYTNDQGEIMLSHNTFWENGLLKDAFHRIENILEQNPREFIRIHLSEQAKNLPTFDWSVDELLPKQVRRDLYSDYTVEELLNAGIQGVVFSGGETNFEARSLGAIDCSITESNGDDKRDNLLNLFTTFATWQTSSATNLYATDLLQRCENSSTHGPQFINSIAVNDYQSANLMPIIDALNRRSNPLV